MSPSFAFGGRSDVGMQRSDNQDSMYAGPRLLAVADGVGGAARGDIASRLTISALIRLDAEPVTDPRVALLGAAQDADTAIRETVARHAKLTGMSTTLTAILASDGVLTLAHIGDSRAYVLHAGQLIQLTDDHTLVQSLLDDGQITPEEALTHPRRSWILRALDGRGAPDLDLAVIDAEVGDRLLVCSDGLSSYVDEASISRALAGDDPQTAASRLVDLALRAGGSDNISCAVADVIDDDVTTQPIIAGAVAEPEPSELLASNVPPPDVPNAADAEMTDHLPRRRSIGRRLAVVAGLVIILIGAGVAITTVYIHHQWYVAPEAGKVAVYQGVQGNAAGVKLSSRKTLTDIPITALPQDDQQRVNDGIDASGGKTGADQVVSNLRSDACALATTTAEPLSKASPTGSASSTSTRSRSTLGKSTHSKGQLAHGGHSSPPAMPTWCVTP